MLKAQYSLPLQYLSDESHPLLDVNHQLWSANNIICCTCCGTDYKYLLGDGSFTVSQVLNMLHLVYHYAFFRRSLEALLFNFCCGTR